MMQYSPQSALQRIYSGELSIELTFEYFYLPDFLEEEVFLVLCACVWVRVCVCVLDDVLLVLLLLMHLHFHIQLLHTFHID